MSKKIVDYIVVCEPTPIMLEKAVSRNMKNSSLVPLGGVSVTATKPGKYMYCQAMVEYNECGS